MPTDREPLMTEEEAAIGDRPIPVRAHPRAIRWGDWLVKRTSKTMVRVTSPMGYLDVPLSGPHKVSDATSAAAKEVRSGETRWMPVPSREGGRAPTHAERAKSGGLRLDVYLDEETADDLARLRPVHGTNTAVVIAAIRRLAAGTTRAAEP